MLKLCSETSKNVVEKLLLLSQIVHPFGTWLNRTVLVKITSRTRFLSFIFPSLGRVISDLTLPGWISKHFLLSPLILTWGGLENTGLIPQLRKCRKISTLFVIGWQVDITLKTLLYIRMEWLLCFMFMLLHHSSTGPPPVSKRRRKISPTFIM